MIMIKTGVCNLPLHPGRCPPWLFKRMKKLGGFLSEIIIDEYGQKEYLKRLSDPYFFQAFGCVLGFDYHSSGLTTTVCGALKEAINDADFGIKVAGGKKTAKRTPLEIENSFSLSTSNIQKLVYASKMTAKIDNSLVQDNYAIYSHTIIFTEEAEWAVIQQGLNNNNSYARRYHWLSDNVESFVEEPHSAICCDKKESDVLDMTNKNSEEARKTSLDIVNDNPQHLLKYFNGQALLNDFIGTDENNNKNNNHNIKRLHMPKSHFIINMRKTNIQTLQMAYEIQPKNYEELVAVKGVGPKTIRSLALISEIVYGAQASWKDPAKYSFAHGGKDGIPYPVDRKLYDNNINILKEALSNSKLGDKDRLHAIKRLSNFYQ